MFDREVEVSPGLVFDNKPTRMAVHRETGIELIVQPECKVAEHHEYWMLGDASGLYVDIGTGEIRPLIHRITMVAGLDGVGISGGRPDSLERQWRLQTRGLLPVHQLIGDRPDDPAKVLAWEQTLLQPEMISRFEKHYASRKVVINLDAWRPDVVLAALRARISNTERSGAITEAARLKEIYVKASARLEGLIKSIEAHRKGLSPRAPKGT